MMSSDPPPCLCDEGQLLFVWVHSVMWPQVVHLRNLNQDQPHSYSLKTAVLIGRRFTRFSFLGVFPGRMTSRSSASLPLHWTKQEAASSLSLILWWVWIKETSWRISARSEATAGLWGTTNVTWTTCYRYFQHGRRPSSWPGVGFFAADRSSRWWRCESCQFISHSDRTYFCLNVEQVDSALL